MDLLQRLNGSALKGKGQSLVRDLDEHPLIRNKDSLLDKTLRIKMDSPIFRELQDAIEPPGGSKDLLGMAEHVITNIYALGEHLDALCNEIIQQIPLRSPPPVVVQDFGYIQRSEYSQQHRDHARRYRCLFQ